MVLTSSMAARAAAGLTAVAVRRPTSESAVAPGTARRERRDGGYLGRAHGKQQLVVVYVRKDGGAGSKRVILSGT